MFSLSLRQKLLLVSSLVLVIPWLGLRYVKAVEDYLQDIILDNLSAYTQSVATNIETAVEKIPSFPAGDSVYASPLRVAPSLDGYDADWGDYSSPEIQLMTQSNLASGPELKIARHEDSLYFFVKVKDQHIRYFQPDMQLDDQRRVDGIELQLVINDTPVELVIITEAPGLVSARDITTNQRYSRIQGTWRERELGSGYQVEFKMPVSYAQRGLKLTINNSDPGVNNRFSLGNRMLPVLSAPDTLRAHLSQFGLIDGRRLRLLDNSGRMLASVGSLSVAQNLKPVNPLFAWLLIPNTIADPWDGKTSLARADIKAALQGEPVSMRSRVNDNSSMMLSSAWPVLDNGEVIAVVLIEESTAALQILQRSALASMLNVSLLIFALLVVTLVAFASRLSSRIRRLETITDNAIDNQGRVQGELPKVKKGDELDELNNHIREMLIRLRNYHDYLEKLAARLSHEIRTPVAVVRSSIENIQSQRDSLDNSLIDDNLSRANQGVSRLQTLLHRMSEATRLEQSVHESEVSTLDITQFLAQVVAGYRDIYPSHEFVSDSKVSTVEASGDLLAQALDKLIANAVSFAEQGTIIRISADQSDNGWTLSVDNQGPQLPEGMESQLFQSMVSIRDKSSSDGQPHLGLGLHIVQLIAEFHGGHASAHNTKDGVCFMMKLIS